LASTTTQHDLQRALAEVELLRELDEQVLHRLAERVGRRSWRAGEVLFAQGTPGGSLLVLTSGAVTVYRSSPGGERAALVHLRSPATLGEVTLLDGSPRTATVEAVEDTTALELGRADLLELLHTHPGFLDAVLRSLGGLVRRLSDQAADHMLLDFAGRVAKTLAGLSGPPPGPHVVRLSQTRLAELAGGTRQSLNQVLGAFATRGWVRVEGRSVVVEDLAALRRRGGLPAARP
jgi:CRP/FNR family cyclic AMP-dependent transcriptional regulator